MGRVDSFFFFMISLERFWDFCGPEHLPIVRAMKPKLPNHDQLTWPLPCVASHSRINIPWPSSKANLRYPENNNKSSQELEV